MLLMWSTTAALVPSSKCKGRLVVNIASTLKIYLKRFDLFPRRMADAGYRAPCVFYRTRALSDAGATADSCVNMS